jgi:hypothetical protein
MTSPRWPVWRLLASIAIFQAAWFACVISAAHHAMGWGIAAMAVSIGWQLAISDRRTADLLLIAAAFGTGLLWDTFLVQAGIVEYASHAPLAAVAPLWILAMWMQLGAVLRGPLRALHGRHWLAAGLGAAGGAVAYAGAARLGACAFPDAVLALATLAAGWGVLLPLLLYLARCLDQQRRPAPAQ